MRGILRHPLTWGVVGLIAGAKFASSVNNLPGVSKIPPK
jgi:hypothetical protein